MQLVGLSQWMTVGLSLNLAKLRVLDVSVITDS